MRSEYNSRVVNIIAFILLAVTLVTWRIWAFHTVGFGIVALFFTVLAGYYMLTFALAIRGFDRRNDDEPVQGKILAIIPAYNESEESVVATVNALLNGSVVPDVIHVVDDGSEVALTGFQHPKVIWSRQENKGKREAQLSVIEQYSAADFDFIVTVDSDSLVNGTALENALKAFNDSSVMGVTSTVLVSNWRDSLLAWLSDYEIVAGMLISRRARASVGAVTPTSGAFSVYRSHILFDNQYDYRVSGTFSDDRRLAHYCLLKGAVVSMNGAVVDTVMPTEARGLWKQRVRWFKGYWKYMPWEVANLSGWSLFMRYMSTIANVVFPIAFTWLFIVLPLVGKGFFWPILVLWVALVYCQGFMYLARPNGGMSFKRKVFTWVFLTPLLIPYNLFIIRPALYWALFTVNSDRWNGHREK